MSEYSDWECPTCKTNNLVSLGGETAPDIEAVKCHQCGAVHLLPGVADFRKCVGGDVGGPDDWYVEDGMPTHATLAARVRELEKERNTYKGVVDALRTDAFFNEVVLKKIDPILKAASGGEG